MKNKFNKMLVFVINTYYLDRIKIYKIDIIYKILCKI